MSKRKNHYIIFSISYITQSKVCLFDVPISCLDNTYVLSSGDELLVCAVGFQIIGIKMFRAAHQSQHCNYLALQPRYFDRRKYQVPHTNSKEGSLSN